MNETDPRVRRTRKLLLEAFGALLGEKSFSEISVQDIAERATVNRATFYAHFVDKYALLDEAMSEQFRATVTSHVSPTAPFTVDNLARLIATVIQSQAQFHDHCQHQAPGRDISPMLEAKAQQELSAYLLEWLSMAPDAGEPSPEAREAIASLLSWAIFGAAAEWAHGKRGLSARARAEQLAGILMGGVGGLLRAEPLATISRP